MRTTTIKLAGIILAVMLCLSLLPVSAMAENVGSGSDDPSAVSETALPESTPEASAESTPASTDEQPVSTEVPPSESQLEPESVTPSMSDIQPELIKMVDAPLVKVQYHYYDEAQNADITDFEAYTVNATHSYYATAVATENDAAITIAANLYPSMIPVSTDALRFRVMMDGDMDITTLAAYDSASGQVTLPFGCMGHAITVNWYCPASEVTDLPVKVTVSLNQNGKFFDTVNDLKFPSNAGAINVPIAPVDSVVVSQNGIELPSDAYSIADGTLSIMTTPLGGDVSVIAYTPKQARDASGQVSHTRSDNTIYYGYYTHYFTADGNVSFCLNPTAPSIPTGTYPVSRYLHPGTDDLLIKCAYYLYGGPGYDSVKTNLFEDPDSMTAYALSHAVAAYAYLGTMDAFYGVSSTVRDHLVRVLSSVSVQSMPPQGFEAFVYNEGAPSQTFLGWNYAPTGNVEIIKASNNPAMTDGNSCYSLEGAVFNVYDGGNNHVGTITTDANGRGRLDGLAAGSGYYLVETQPPKGYALSGTKVNFTIVSGQTVTVNVTNVAQGDPVTILLKKRDAERNTNEPQGGGTMAGALFTVKFYKGLYTASQLAGKTPARSWVLRTDSDGFAMLHRDYLVSGDALYYDSSGRIATLPLGTVTIQETQPPTGYLLNNELFVRQITAQGNTEPVYTYNEPVVPDNPIRGGVSIEKWDFDLNRRAAPQGDATLGGAVFEIYNRNAHSVIVNSKTYAPGALVYTMTTDETGTATTANDLLPYGSYEIIEKTPPVGYLGTGVLRQSFNITTHSVVVNLKTSATVIKNNVIRGGVEIEKWDIERDERRLKQGDATLAGAVLEIWNRSPKSVVVDGREYAPNQVVYTITTDKNGWAGTANNLLPYGSYEIIEKTPPTGYLNTGIIKQSFQIRENGVVVSLKTSEKVIRNNIIRGGVRIEKWDNEIDEHRAQGGATLEGAVFELVNRSADSVLVQDVLYGVGEVVYTFATDATGSALTPSDLLPYGTYEVRETLPPTGYLATGVLSRTFTIREHGKTVELNTPGTAIKNNPIRGDLRGVKISDGDTKRMANIPFAITSVTTGESHVIVTDRNGEFNTASSWNPHSQNTNRGESDRDGVWFGELRVLNDNLGALLYDTYLLEELPCENNKGYELLSFEVSVYRHNVVINLGTLTNDHIPVPEIFTTAMEREMMANSTYVSETTTILDTVYYSGLKPGNSYTLNGVLMDKATGEPLLINGETVTASKEFRAAADSGSVLVEYTFDSTGIAGKSVVVFESLEFEGTEIAAHADIDDEGQTISFITPAIGTSAAGSDGKKVLDIDTKVTLVDTVSFENLIAGKTYTLKGILMDKATGEPLMIDGEPVTASKEFRAATGSGSVLVEFTFDATGLAGKSVVVFESLEYVGKEIAVHADIENEGQTVSFMTPAIGTSAAGPDGEKVLDIDAKVTLVDTVSYENLKPGKTYTLKGILMDKATGKPLLIGGKQITAEANFMPETSSGSATVTFIFDSSGLAGKSIVVFESLSIGGKEIAAHADIKDEGQTVTFKTPEIGTTAKAEDGSKTLPLAEKVTLVDTVTFKNLAPRMEYVLKGTVMDKESGRPLMSGGKPITSKVKFTPAAATGTVEVQFTFDTRAIAGRTLVVFESLEYEGKEIAVHAEISDEGQSITVNTPKPGPEPSPKPETPVPSKPVPQTSDNYMVVIWLVLAGISLPGLLVNIVLLRKKKRKTTIIVVLCAVLLAGSVFMAFGEIRQYSDEADAYAKLTQFATPPVSEDGSIPDSGEQASSDGIAAEEVDLSVPSLPIVDFTALREINPDLCGWLVLEGTSVNYPIAQGSNNSQYLNRLYDGSRGKAGTPFLDYENSPNFTDKNSIVYGHNLLDGSMFSCLTEYAQQPYYDAHPSLLLLTPDRNYRVEVFTAFSSSPSEAGLDGSPWRQSWEKDGSFDEWSKQMAARSVIDTGVSPDVSDKVLTLSTCTRGGRDRFVVMGRLVPIG